jgi:hypothetical protein
MAWHEQRLLKSYEEEARGERKGKEREKGKKERGDHSPGTWKAGDTKARQTTGDYPKRKEGGQQSASFQGKSVHEQRRSPVPFLAPALVPLRPCLAGACAPGVGGSPAFLPVVGALARWAARGCLRLNPCIGGLSRLPFAPLCSPSRAFSPCPTNPRFTVGRHRQRSTGCEPKRQPMQLLRRWMDDVALSFSCCS